MSKATPKEKPSLDLSPEIKDLEPLDILSRWVELARGQNLNNPDAFTLSTANKRLEVSSRVLLCKEIEKDAIVFYTNYQSHKASDLNDNPHAAANFYWDSLIRQVKIQGRVHKTSRSESEAYWDTRPRDSQLSQWVSEQSCKVDSRNELDRRIQVAQEKFKNQNIPCPENWGGYRLTPNQIEVWIGRASRLHDRFLYTKVGSKWDIQRLCP